MEWNHNDEWRKTGNKFTVVISRREVPLSEFERNLGINRWAVYAYLYPDHPHFAKFEGPDLLQDATINMPLHGGASFLQYHYTDKGALTSVQVGADYGHLDDNCYSYKATKAEAAVVFADADWLVRWLEEYTSEAL